MIETCQASQEYVAEFERLAASATVPQWLAATRKAAFEWFGEQGFPSTRDEDWRYTNVAGIAETPFVAAPVAHAGFADIAEWVVGDHPACLLVFVNGHFAAACSRLDGLPPGLRVTPLAAALAGAEAPWLQAHLTGHAPYQHSAFSAWNTAFIHEGAAVYVPSSTVVTTPIQILYLTLSGSEPAVTHPRTLIVVEPSSQVTVLETYAGLGDTAGLTNAVTEVVAGENAVVDHYKIQREGPRARHMAHLYIHQQRNSNVMTHVFSLGAQLCRNDITAVLDGEGCDCGVKGLTMLSDHQHADNHLWIEHVKPRCNSREYFKGIYDDHARGVFSGRIKVYPDAQKTDAKQTNMSLLLSEHALADSKPQLEIFADDVKCTHGATIGQIDEEAIFYLRSRGIDEQAARSLLVYAFAGETINEVRIEDLRRVLQQQVLLRLPQGESLQEHS